MPPITLSLVLVILALGLTIGAASGARIPLWLPVLLICLAQLRELLPR